MASTPKAPSAARARQLSRRLRALRRVADALAGATTADEVCRLALETAVEELRCEAGSVLLLEPEQALLRFRHVLGPTPEIEASLRGHAVSARAGISGRVLRSGRGAIVQDVTIDRAHNRSVDSRTAFHTRSLLAAPLTVPGDRVVGVIEVLNRRRGRFDREDLEVLTLLASQAGLALETARLGQSAALASVAHRIGDLSHDVKNLLTPVSTGVQTLLLLLGDVATAARAQAPPPDSPLAAALSELEAMGPELIDLALSGVHDVQERVREIADAVKGIVSAPLFEPTDLSALAAGVARVLYPVAEPAGVAVDVSGMLGVSGLLRLDRRRMFNCLYNLVHNAIVETPPGGTIWLSATREGRPGEADDALVVVVRDNGRGMPPDVRERLFTDDAVSTKPGGTGLGTRIVRGAIETHGGTVSVESAPGAGARFTLRIPWARVGPTP